MVYSNALKCSMRFTMLATLAGASSAALAGNPLSFSDEAFARGLDYHMGFNINGFGAGIMLVDLDDDGDLDIIIGGEADDSIGIFENDGTGNFTDRSLTSGITSGIQVSGISGADYDNDGDIDLYISGWLEPTRFYRNDGNFTFTDVTTAAGLDLTCAAMATSWSDVNGDGFLDFYVSVRTFTNLDPTRNQFYMNNGDGTFTEMAAAMGIQAGDDPTLLTAFYDYDRDGDADLYLGTDKGSGGPTGNFYNRLFENNGGVFTEITAATNAWGYVDCMGIAVGDLNFDGFFDLYMTNTMAGNVLLMHDGVGAYVDQTIPAGMANYRVGWSTIFADFDNDTELDTYLCNMMGPNRLYRGSQTWPLIDEAPSAGVAENADVFCAAVGDIDGDNDLDIVSGNTDGRVRLYINNSVDAQTNNWIRFNVVGNNADQFGIGTCIDIQAGGKSQLRQIRAGVNYKGQDEYTAHFGLAGSTVVDQIMLVFEGGEVRNLTNAPANHTWTLYPESMLGDPNGNGRVDWFELSAAVNARTPAGQTIKPGDEIYDMNGDFVIDLADLALMGLNVRTPSVFRR